MHLFLCEAPFRASSVVLFCEACVPLIYYFVFQIRFYFYFFEFGREVHLVGVQSICVKAYWCTSVLLCTSIKYNYIWWLL